MLGFSNVHYRKPPQSTKVLKDNYIYYYITMVHRNPLEKFFITFPQTTISREEFSLSLPSFKYIKTVQETHEDGNFHLHTIIELEKPISKVAFIKFLTQKYPEDYKRIKVESLRSISHADVYLNKEDSQAYVSGTPPKSKQDIQYSNKLSRHWIDQRKFAHAMGYPCVCIMQIKNDNPFKNGCPLGCNSR